MEQQPDLELAIRLSRASALLVRELRRANNHSDLSLTEQATLGFLDQHTSMLPSMLAEIHHISPQAVSQVLNRLHEKGCVTRSFDDTDGRKILITLTKKGRSVLHEIRMERGKWLAEVIAQNLNRKEMKQLTAVAVIMEKLAATKIK